MAAHSVSERIFDKWFSFPNVLLLAPIPAVTAALFAHDCSIIQKE
jgi:cytochrome d ubiquinol oxidase subunit II